MDGQAGSHPACFGWTWDLGGANGIRRGSPFHQAYQIGLVWDVMSLVPWTKSKTSNLAENGRAGKQATYQRLGEDQFLWRMAGENVERFLHGKPPPVTEPSLAVWRSGSAAHFGVTSLQRISPTNTVANVNIRIGHQPAISESKSLKMPFSPPPKRDASHLHWAMTDPLSMLLSQPVPTQMQHSAAHCQCLWSGVLHASDD